MTTKRDADQIGSDSDGRVESCSDVEPETKKPRVTSFPKSQIRVLLLEGIHPTAVKLLEDEGFQVETHAKSLSEAELKEKLKHVHAVGVRSKTKLSKAVLDSAPRLLCTGNFCIGTDSVDLTRAQELGIPAFNAPFSNTRSVAELILAHVINLSRRAFDVSMKLHAGEWNKSAAGCYEIRGKTIGIVGYGHVGSQVSVMAEAFGMNVLFYDISPKMGLGNARIVSSLDQLLELSDFVTLHVPSTPETKLLIKERELRLMKKGSYLINYSRGTVVDVDALAAVLKDGHLAGAAVDVFPAEPKGNGPGFASVLQGCPNTILTPHIGGSTVEAQELIGREVANKIISFINDGCTEGAVNFPQLRPPKRAENTHCVMNIHRNVPGVLGQINHLLSDVNVQYQQLQTIGSIGYMMIYVESLVSHDLRMKMRALPTNIRTRVLF